MDILTLIPRVYFEYFGRITVIYVAIIIFMWFMKVLWWFIRPKKNIKKYGKWAIVTGAAEGIGEAFSLEFAKKGMNVVLIDRNLEGLYKLNEKILDKYKVKTLLIDIDLTRDFAHGVNKALRNLDIGILVNNAGISYPFPDDFINLPEELADTMINLNIHAVVKMTRIVLLKMKAQKRGLIINIGSQSSRPHAGMPLLALYVSTKRFIQRFSVSLHWELKQHNIDIQCVEPYFVTSRLSKIRNPSLFVLTPKQFVNGVMCDIGYEYASIPSVAQKFIDWGIAGVVLINLFFAVDAKGPK